MNAALSGGLLCDYTVVRSPGWMVAISIRHVRKVRRMIRPTEDLEKVPT